MVSLFEEKQPFRRVDIGKATLYHGDAYEILTTVLELDNDKTALITDPPYDFKTSGGGKLRASRKYVDEIAKRRLDQGFDVSIVSPRQFAAAVVFCHDDQGPEIWRTLRLRYWRAVCLFWQKTNPMPVCNGNYVPECELYFHAWRDCMKPVGDVTSLRRVWRGPVGKSEFDHPTVKPIDLMRKIVGNVGAPVIVDPFMGTGTTGVAAIEAGAEFIGIEIDENHFEIARKRIETAVNGRGGAGE